MTINSDNYRNIIFELKDYVYRNHKLPSIKEISDITEISYNKCVKLCDTLEGQNQIYTISGGGRGIPRVIIPHDMMEIIFSTQPRPKWIDEEEYGFKEIKKLVVKSEEIHKELDKFYKIQLLLFGTDVPLEKSIAYVLEYLKFENVIHHLDNRDYADVTFDHNGIKYLIEVEGTTKQGNKEKVLQLSGWLKNDIEAGIAVKKLKGIFALNHERDNPPKLRGDPLTPHAIQYMTLYDFILVTTQFLYNIVRKVHAGDISEMEAQKLLLQGVEYGG